MMNEEIITYSLRNLAKRKTRSFLTILSIFIGIASIFLFISFGLGLYNYINEFKTSTSADKITIMAKGLSAPGLDNSFALTDDDIKAVQRTSGVYQVTGAYNKPVKIKQGDTVKYVFMMGFDPEKPLVWDISNVKIAEGRDLIKGDFGKVVVGSNYLIPDKVFSKAYKIGDSIEVDGEKMRIVGVMESIGNPSDDAQIYVTNDFYKEITPNGSSYSMIVAQVDVNDIQGTIQRVEKNLRNERGLEKGKEDFFVASFQDLLDQYTSALDIIIMFVFMIALISVVVSAVNTANTMITSVLERTREIGTMKAVGAQNFEILSIFLFESAFLGFLGGTVGIIIGYGISSTAGLILKNLGWGFLQPAFPAYLFLSLITFATLTGAISGIWPAYRASKLKTVVALRYE